MVVVLRKVDHAFGGYTKLVNAGGLGSIYAASEIIPEFEVIALEIQSAKSRF